MKTAANRPPRVLVVDDEASVRTFAARVLRNNGYDVVVASDGPEALRIVEGQQQGSFDLFIIDVMMPQMWGDELARRLRRHDPDVKVLYFTAYSERLFEDHKFPWANEALLDKPGGITELLDSVSLMLFGDPPSPEGVTRRLIQSLPRPVAGQKAIQFQCSHSASETLVRHYYACFNERRFQDAAALFATDALVEHLPLGGREYGAGGYLRFAQTWTTAFPDAVLHVERLERRSDSLIEAHLLRTGTHLGNLDMGMYLFRPTRAKTTLRFRELLDVRDGKIVAATLSFDLTDLVVQLTTVDYIELAATLERIRQLSEELDHARDDPARQRDVADRLGPELDAARRALRPHYHR